MYKNIFLEDEQATLKMGEKIGNLLKSGDVVCLYGELGVGKTYITKGIAKALDVIEDVTSPTFVKIQEYDGKIKLFHFDVYKVNDDYEMYSIGFDDYLGRDGIIIIEWAENIKDILPLKRIDIRLQYCENGRMMDIEFIGDIKIDNFDLEV